MLVLTLNLVFIYSLYRGGSGRARGRRLTTSPPPSPRPITAATVPSAVTNTATPLLDRLDKFRIRKNVMESGPGQLEPCEGWADGVPDASMEEPQRWQIVVDGEQDTFVFSAYFDPRSCSHDTISL